MKSPVKLKEDRENREAVFRCADCGSFSIASWSEEVAAMGAEHVELVVERESQLAQQTACKCEPVEKALQVCYQLKDAFDRPLLIVGVDRHTPRKEGTYLIRVRPIEESTDNG